MCRLSLTSVGSPSHLPWPPTTISSLLLSTTSRLVVLRFQHLSESPRLLEKCSFLGPYPEVLIPIGLWWALIMSMLASTTLELLKQRRYIRKYSPQLTVSACELLKGTHSCQVTNIVQPCLHLWPLRSYPLCLLTL